MAIEKSGELIKLDLARSRIERYLERLNAPTDSSNFSPLLPITGNTPATSTTTKEHTVLNLSHALLTDEDFLQLAPELKKLTLITELNLETNSLTGTSIKALLDIFPKLERLHLSRNELNENDGCYYLAQFKRLSYVDVSQNCLKSEDLEKLQQSNSLLSVGFGKNRSVDIVRKARLLGACEYNNKTRIQQNVGASKMDCTKDDYIAKNLTQFVKSVQLGENLSRIITAYPPAEYFSGLKK